MKTLDVGIGMALMFLFVSLLCSAIREFGELLIKTRATALERGIREMLGEALHAAPAHPAGAAGAAAHSLTEQLYNHPMISSLFGGTYRSAKPGPILGRIPMIGRNGLPSYIPAENFAQALLQIVRAEAAVPSSATLNAAHLRTWVETTLPGGSHLAKAICTALDTAGDTLAQTQKALEKWFDSTMDRVSGWYKRRTQVWLFVIGLVCAALLNIDAITVMKALSTDDALRGQVVRVAGDVLTKCANKPETCPDGQQPPAGTATPRPDDLRGSVRTGLDHVKDATAQMAQVSWPVGWDDGAPGPQYRIARAAAGKGKLPAWWWLPVVGGWLITAIGVTFGAAFWFDLLNRFMVVRSTIKPDEKSPKEKSKS